MQRHAKKNAQTAHLHAMQTKAKHRAASAMQKKQLPSPSYAEKNKRSLWGRTRDLNAEHR
jgi:hypothetical protein